MPASPPASHRRGFVMHAALARAFLEAHPPERERAYPPLRTCLVRRGSSSPTGDGSSKSSAMKKPRPRTRSERGRRSSWTNWDVWRYAAEERLRRRCASWSSTKSQAAALQTSLMLE
jgi:hypothetical protein